MPIVKLEYTIKGTDYWWMLTTLEVPAVGIGRGIVPDWYWEKFLKLFQNEEGKLTVTLQERV